MQARRVSTYSSDRITERPAKRGLAASLAVAALLAAGSAYAGDLSLDLGQSSQDYTLWGLGAYAPGFGSFYNQQGSESYNSITNTTTDTLSGAITGANFPNFASGSYSFVTTYTGTPIGMGGTQIYSETDQSNLNYFYYTTFDPSVNMTLYLTGTPGGSLTIPVVIDGSYHDLPYLSFAFTGPYGCTGVPTCSQNVVGLTPGATQSTPTDIYITTSAVPEPSEWVLMMIGIAAIGWTMRRRGSGALAA